MRMRERKGYSGAQICLEPEHLSLYPGDCACLAQFPRAQNAECRAQRLGGLRAAKRAQQVVSNWEDQVGFG